MADVIYNSFKKDIMDGTIDLDTHTISCLLVSGSYTPNQDTDTNVGHVSDEAVGTGYTAGGKDLASVSITADNTDNEGVFDADDVTWSSSTITARAAVLYKNTGAATTGALIAYVDFGADKSSSSGNFTVQWNSEGILNLN